MRIKKHNQKRIFVRTPFLSLLWKWRGKNSCPKATLFFASISVSAWPKSLLQIEFKNHKNVWTDLKKTWRFPNRLEAKSNLKTHPPTTNWWNYQLHYTTQTNNEWRKQIIREKAKYEKISWKFCFKSNLLKISFESNG